jgi:hypothetical protein
MRASSILLLALTLGVGCAANTPPVPPAPPPPSAAPIEAPRTDALKIETKTKARSFPPAKNSDAPQGGMGFSFEPSDECKEQLAWPEVKGAASAEIDASINRALVNDAWVFAHKEDFAQLRKCLVGERAQASRGFEVMHNANGVLAVRTRELTRYEGGTHPWDPGPEKWFVFDTKTGAKIAWKELLDDSKGSLQKVGTLLDRCVEAYVREVNGGDASALEDMREKVNVENAELLVAPTPRGLHFAAVGYAPPARVLEGEGPTITWSALIRARVLRQTGPAARLVEGVAPPGPVEESPNPCADPNVQPPKR